jgi:hypothetical protein
VDCGWLYSIWDFVSCVQLKIDISQGFVPRLSREHDRMIMGMFLSLNLPTRHLRILNACRCFLQVITLSDITMADGSKIIGCVKCGILGNDRVSSLIWPKQSRPPESAWCLWWTLLATLESHGKLIRPLWRWVHPTHQKWKWYKSGSTVYQQLDDGS